MRAGVRAAVIRRGWVALAPFAERGALCGGSGRWIFSSGAVRGGEEGCGTRAATPDAGGVGRWTLSREGSGGRDGVAAGVTATGTGRAAGRATTGDG